MSPERQALFIEHGQMLLRARWIRVAAFPKQSRAHAQLLAIAARIRRQIQETP